MKAASKFTPKHIDAQLAERLIAQVERAFADEEAAPSLTSKFEREARTNALLRTAWPIVAAKAYDR